jgi:NitT/TauT family transport system ATP-binding protein
MPQCDLLVPWRTALGNPAVALENRGVSRAEARRRTRPFFGRFGLASFENARPAQLPGGVRQRVGFCRTLMAGKDILLLGEPFGALGSITRAQMLQWLVHAMDAVQRTVLLVTHHVEEALPPSRPVVVLSQRPDRVVRVLEADHRFEGARREIVTSPGFVSLTE